MRIESGLAELASLINPNSVYNSKKRLHMYKTKNEIYKDYQVAVKFEVEPRSLSKDLDYPKLYSLLTSEQGAKLLRIDGTIENFNSQYPLSTGLYVEVPEYTEDNKEIGVRYLVLEHESGIEIFLPLVASGLLYKVLSKIGEEIFKQTLEESVKKLLSFMKKSLTKVMPKNKIIFVEIRTENKGVMRVKFEDFDVEQITCLLKNYSNIEHLSELNQTCFNGKLLDSPTQIHYLPQAND